jgi:hypothetical protein
MVQDLNRDDPFGSMNVMSDEMLWGPCTLFLNTLQARQIRKSGYFFLLVNTEAINDEPVFYKYLTPQAIASAHFYF